MEISAISFADSDYSGNLFDDYGPDLYADEVKYLKSKVFYKGLVNSEKEISIYFKIIKVDVAMMIGANNPHESGYIFSLVVVETKSIFSHETYKYDKMDVKDIGKNISGSSYDAVTTIWGEKWRMPTLKEIRELIIKCKWEETTIHGHNGYKITGNNGNLYFCLLQDSI